MFLFVNNNQISFIAPKPLLRGVHQTKLRGASKKGWSISESVNNSVVDRWFYKSTGVWQVGHNDDVIYWFVTNCQQCN